MMKMNWNGVADEPRTEVRTRSQCEEQLVKSDDVTCLWS